MLTYILIAFCKYMATSLIAFIIFLEEKKILMINVV